jgi:SagB-type dehydrogenase family enzyme
MARAGAIWNRTVVRKRVAVSVTLALLLAVSLTFLTGFVAAALDLNRFAYHRYAAYLAIALAAAHIVLHWRSLTAQVQRWLVRQPGPAPTGIDPPPAPPGAAPRLPRRGLLWPALSFVAGAGLGRLASPRGAAVALEPGEDLGQIYHQWSKPDYAGLLIKSIHARPQPTPYKEYAGAVFLPLPSVPAPSGPPLEAVIQQRRSVREYADRSLTLDELSRLLHYSTGITDRRDPTLAFRAVPSSGALFPIEVYPVLFNVAGASPGAYHYDVQRHRLALVRSGDFRQEVFRAAVSQEMIHRASLVLVLTGIFERVQWKYLDRSYRYLLLEAGHLGQNVYLAATALGLGPCGIGAFFDDDLNRLLQLDGREEATVYLLAVGPVR